jgi:hypothetical protein
MYEKELKFRSYGKIGRKSSGRSYISIGKEGRFGFSSGFIRKYFGEDKPKYTYFKVSEDEESLYFGFKFGSDDNDMDPDRMKLLYPKSKSSNAIATSKNIYVDYKKILDEKHTKKLTPSKYDDEKFGTLYVIEIQK